MTYVHCYVPVLCFPLCQSVHRKDIPLASFGLRVGMCDLPICMALPVGRVEYMAIHSFSFIEYLTAIGEGRFVEFILIDGKIIPVEVKSGHNAHLKSIHQFMNDTNHDIAIRIWSGTHSVDQVKTLNGKKFRLINLPFYLISALPHILNNL